MRKMWLIASFALFLGAGCSSISFKGFKPCNTLQSFSECTDNRICGYVGFPTANEDAHGEWQGVQKYCITQQEVGSVCGHDTQCKTQGCNDTNPNSQPICQ